MDTIDVHDLPEEDAQLIAAFIEFLRQHRQQQRALEQKETALRDLRREDSTERERRENLFAIWPLGVKGTLSREEIYDYL